MTWSGRSSSTVTLFVPPPRLLSLPRPGPAASILPSALVWQCICRAAKTRCSFLHVSIWKRRWGEQVVGQLEASSCSFSQCLPDLVVCVTGPLLVSWPPWWMATFPLFIAPLNHVLAMLLWPIFAALFTFPPFFLEQKTQISAFGFLYPASPSSLRVYQCIDIQVEITDVPIWISLTEKTASHLVGTWKMFLSQVLVANISNYFICNFTATPTEVVKYVGLCVL